MEDSIYKAYLYFGFLRYYDKTTGDLIIQIAGNYYKT
jgi:hypothetical protein